MCPTALATVLSTSESQKEQAYTPNIINYIAKRLMRNFKKSRCDEFILELTLIVNLIYVLNWYITCL